MKNNNDMKKKISKKEVEKNVNREISAEEMEEVTGGAVPCHIGAMIRRPR